jgi:hypothetical protein
MVRLNVRSRIRRTIFNATRGQIVLAVSSVHDMYSDFIRILFADVDCMDKFEYKQYEI